MINSPMPGQAKIFSTRIAPVSNADSSSPIMVMMGIAALRRACSKITRHSATPLARAVTT